MSQPIVINIGAIPNDGTGDPLRTAFNDTNLNFANVFTAGPVGSNVQIANNTILTTNTNGNLVLAPNGTGVVQSNVSLVPDQNRIRNLGSVDRLWDTTYTQYLQTAYANIGTANISNIGLLTIPVANLHILGGTNGYVLQTDGAGNLTWTAQTGGSGNATPGGANTQVQFNDAGAFGGQAGFTFNKTANTLSAVKINTTDVFNLNGIVLENSSLTQGATAAVVIPTNGSSDPIQVNNTYGNIALQTGAGSGITASWSFNNDGSLSLPGGDLAGLGNVIGPGNISYPFGPGPVLLANTVGNNSAYLSLTAVANAEGVIGYVGIANFGGNSSTGLIETSDGTGNTYNWYFQNDGTTAFPNYTFPVDDGANAQVLTTDGNGILVWSNVSGGGGNTGNVTFDNNTVIGTGDSFGGGGLNLAIGPDSIANGNVQYLQVRGGDNPTHIHLDTGDNTYFDQYFGDDGKFVRLDAGDFGNVTVGTYNPGQSYRWTFTSQGGTIFPTLTVQRGDNPSGTITGQTLLFGDINQEAIITTPDGVPGNEYSQRLVINPGAGNNYGEGGDIYLWAGRGGDGSGSGGDIKIRGGQGGANTSGGNGGDGGYIRIEGGDAASSGGYAGYIDITGGTSNAVGGYVTITGGSGQTQGGDANINGGFTNSGPGGRVNINGGGSGSGLSQYGNVNIVAGASTWTFDNTGKLRLPNANVSETIATQGGYISIGNLLVGQGGSLFNTNNDNWALYGNISDPDATITIPSNATAANGTPLSLQVSSNVEITSGGGTWNFNSTGNLNLPGAGVIYETAIPGSSLTGNTIALLPAGGTDPDQQLLVYPTAGPTADDNHLHLTSGNLWNTELFLGNDNFYVKLANTGNVVINSNDDLGNSAQWIFDTQGTIVNSGNLTIQTPSGIPATVTAITGSSGSWESNPSSDLATTGGTGTGLTVDVSQSGGYADAIAIHTPGTGYSNGDAITVVSGSSSASFTISVLANGWTLSTAGILTVPGNINTNGHQVVGASGNLDLSIDGSIQLTAGSGVDLVLTSSGHNWTFDNGGDLTVPGNSTIGTPIATGGAGGNSVTIRAGSSDTFASAPGGDLNLIGGYGSFGDGGGPPGGNVVIASGLSYDSHPGNVSINTGSNQWLLDYTGNLTLPQGGVVYETNIPFGGLSGKTIALKPNGGTSADQQLLVYPTAGADANHLHLTSGNLYNTELFLGNDDLYVKLANTGNIVINSNDGGGNTAQWTFGTDGNLTTPGSGGDITLTGGNIVGANVVGAVTFSATGNITAGNILVTGSIVPSASASPAPSISGFGIINSVDFGASGNISATGNITGANLSISGKTNISNVTINSYSSVPKLWFKGALSAAQNIVSSTDTVTVWNNNSDPLSWGNVSTGHITPTQAGWYEITSRVQFSNNAASNAQNQINHQIAINGTSQAISQLPNMTANVPITMITTAMANLNGTTDYITTTSWSAVAGNAQQINGGNTSMLLIRWISN